MFKFFRRYNKYILVGGGVLLMIAFLIQGTVGQLMGGNPAKREIGRIDGEKVVRLDLDQAGREVDLLRQLVRGLAVADPFRWLMMKREAQAMGLSASHADVSRLLVALGLDDKQMARIGESRHVAPARIRAVLRDWVMVQHYTELVFGRTHRAIEEKVATYRSIEALAQRGMAYPFLYRALDMLNGSDRVSGPLLERFVHQTDSTVAIAAIEVDSDRYREGLAPPEDARLQELFELYRDRLSGQGEPYGFGYRFADRVKLEYLAIPAERLGASARVTKVEAVTYYMENKDAFRETGGDAGSTGEPKPYDSVKARVFALLRNRKAQALGQEMINAARTMLVERERELPMADGYRKLDAASAAGWVALPLDEVAGRLEQTFGVLPTVHRLDDRWRGMDDLGSLPGIGESQLVGSTPAPFLNYVLSARELEPDEGNTLATLRLQAGIGSAPLKTPLGSWYLFRLMAAEAEHSPASLDAVRDQVAADAQRLAAYDLLREQRDSWVQRARTEKLADLAAELGVRVLEPAAFPYRARNVYFGHLEIPDILGIGRHANLVERAFAMAEAVAAAGGSEAASPQVRIDGVDLDTRQSLLLMRIERYMPITRKHYVDVASGANVTHELTFVMAAERTDDPLATEVLTKRVGFVPLQEEAEDGEEGP